MIGSAFKLLLKLAVIAITIRFLAVSLSSNGIDALLITTVIILALLLVSIPYLFNIIKRFFVWIFKGIFGWLWKAPEKKSGANIRSPRMRWRE